MPDDLYDRDIVLWCDRQADLLRRLASGERVNHTVDWPNVIEEIEALGRSETEACRNLLRQALTHIVKQAAWPDHRAVAHWRSETIGMLDSAGRAFSPSMRQLIDFGQLYDRARKAALALEADYGPAEPTPERPPFHMSDLLEQDDPDVTLLVEQLRAAGARSS